MSAHKKAIDLQNNAAKYQFDWPTIEPVFAKLTEEILELQEAINLKNTAHIEAELGDILFVVANLARHLNIDPDLALEQTNIKFSNRFQYVLNALNIKQPKHNHSLKTMEAEWQKSKKLFP